jgi:hypothetical protein
MWCASFEIDDLATFFGENQKINSAAPVNLRRHNFEFRVDSKVKRPSRSLARDGFCRYSTG